MPIILDPPAPSTPAPDPGPLPSAGDRLYARLEPVAYADEANGFPLKSLCGALMDPRQVIDDLTQEGGNVISWGSVLDPDFVPDVGQLPEWLAQLPGVQLPPSASTIAEKRARIKAAAGFYRGTRQAVLDEVTLTLTGTKTIRFIERVDYNAYHATLVSDPAETPDPAATLRAALAQKPSGMKFTVIQSATPVIDEGTLTIDAVGASVTIDAVTIPDVAP